MESGYRASEVLRLAEDSRDSRRFHLRLLAGCFVLAGLACIQDAGMLIADTKFDLVLSPGDFLARALHLWDPQGAFGQLQNQAYGYLWPMGPFFLLGEVLDVPGWLIQRFWIALVMCVAFTGAGKVLRELGVRSHAALIISAFAYALSPRMITTLGSTSIEAWPSALVPWVLLPLVVGATRGSPRRAAALAGLAVAMVGGVNAVATFAVVPLGALWLLTRAPGPRRRSMMIWWPLFTALGTLWWLVPLFTLGAYSPPFLDYIESASVTTIPTNLFDSLRGTSDWVAYVSTEWRAGNDLITTFFGPLNSAVLLMLGTAGLMLRRNPHRQFLVLALLAGLSMVTLGHVGELPGWFGSALQGSLDGALKPLRNVHKFDPIIRLPLVIGLAWALESRLNPSSAIEDVVDGDSLQRINRGAFAALAVIALAGSMAPVLAGRLTPLNSTYSVPGYWHQTADWLKVHSGEQTALLLPGSSFADYVWGAPRDEPLQSLAESRWAVRNAIPLAPPGNIRMLDAIEERINRGHGSPALVDFLARTGIRFLVVRNDLQPSSDVTIPAVVHEALAKMSGLTRVATFGPDIGGSGHLDKGGNRVLIAGGAQAMWPAVEIFRVPGSMPAVSGSRTPVVAGGPEDLPDLIQMGLLSDAPTELAVTRHGPPDPGSPVILADGLQRRERFFGRINDSYSAVSTAGDRRHSGNPVRDYAFTNQDRWSTTSLLRGAAALKASSSMSDSTAWGGSQPARLPFAAIDGNPETSWMSGVLQKEPTWWQVDLPQERDIRSLTIYAGDDAPERQWVQVLTSANRSDPVLLRRGGIARVAVDAHQVRWVRIQNAGTRPSGQLTLTEVDIPGTKVARSLQLPQLPQGWPDPDAIALRRLGGQQSGCVQVAEDVRCMEARQRNSEEAMGISREFRLASAAQMQLAVRARPKFSGALMDLVQQDQLINATSSSTGVGDPRASALAAIDGRLGTAWTAKLDDPLPRLRLNWLGARSISGIDVRVGADSPVRRPTMIKVSWPKGSRIVSLNSNGHAQLPVFRTDQLVIDVLDAEDAYSIDFNQSVSKLPVGISEVDLDGLDRLPLIPSQEPRQLACGSGPTVNISGNLILTRIKGSPAEFVSGAELEALPCKKRLVSLASGRVAAEVTDAPAFAVTSLALTKPGYAPVRKAAGEPRFTTTGPTLRSIDPEEAGTLAVRENTNPGWRAEQANQPLDSVTLDGWQQGWRLNGASEVTMRFAPNRQYQTGLVLGTVAWFALLFSALWSRRWKVGRDLPFAKPRAVSPTVMVGLAAMAVGLFAGWIGIAVVAAGWAVSGLIGRRHLPAAPWLMSSLLLVAGFAWVLGPWGSPSGWGGARQWPLYPTLLALGGVVGAAVVRRPRLRSRMEGSSTIR